MPMDATSAPIRHRTGGYRLQCFFVPTPTSCAGAMEWKAGHYARSSRNSTLYHSLSIPVACANQRQRFHNFFQPRSRNLFGPDYRCQRLPETINNMVVDAGSPLNAIPAALPTSPVTVPIMDRLQCRHPETDWRRILIA